MDTAGLGRRLREARKVCGLTLDQVAEAIKVRGHHVVSRWETDGKEHRDPDYGTLGRLAELYGVKVSQLLGESPADSPTPPASPQPQAAAGAGTAPAGAGEVTPPLTRTDIEAVMAPLNDRLDAISVTLDQLRADLTSSILGEAERSNPILRSTESRLQAKKRGRTSPSSGSPKAHRPSAETREDAG